MIRMRLLLKKLQNCPSITKSGVFHKTLCQRIPMRLFSPSTTLQNESGDLKVQSPPKDRFINKTVKETTNLFERLAEETGKQDKDTFVIALGIYEKKERIYKRGHVEFIYVAIEQMKKFGVHRDLDVYKKIIDLFPKGKMIPRTVWEVEFRHYPKQQFCCMDVLEQMEDNGVIPDDAMGELIGSVFGYKAHPFRKYRRLMYWLPKFKNTNPFPIPRDLPDDRIELATLVMRRMAIDLHNKVQVFQSEDLDTSVDNTFIVSGQSPQQQQLLREHPKQSPIYVEGAFDVWIRHICMKYFILRADVTPKYKEFAKYEEETPTYIKNYDFNWNFMKEEPSDVIIPPSVHEQSDGTVLAMCITGTSSKDSVASWIKFLEVENPALAEVPVIFLLRTPETGVAVLDGEQPLPQALLEKSFS